MPTIAVEDLLVLIVEPSSVQSRIVRSALETQGIREVSECRSGDEALQHVQREQPDLVVSSYYLPDMTGADLLLRIRDQDGLAGMPFMLISSETRFDCVDPIRQAGAVTMLPKPFFDEQIGAALATTLDWIDETEHDPEAVDADAVHVLVVDDSPFSRKGVRRILNSLGIQHIDEAGDGRDGLAMIEQHFYDILITDYNMPDMDGLELTSQVRNHSEQPSMPVLMITSEEDPERLDAARRAGVSAVCRKPFEPDRLRTQILELLAD